MEELAQIVQRLESGQETLEDSLQQFERGMKLLRSCHRLLDSAAQRIEIVTRMAEDEDVETKDFDATSTLDRRNRASAADEGDTSGKSLF